MGFFNSFVSRDLAIKRPGWFIKKYKSYVHFNKDARGVIASNNEWKTYGVLADLEKDIQKAAFSEIRKDPHIDQEKFFFTLL